MRRAIPVVVLLAILLTALPAGAITFGWPDGTRHPNVGAMIVEYPDGIKYQVCSGTLIAPKVFLTASHCLSWMPASGIAFDKIWVSFDPVLDRNATLYQGVGILNPAYSNASSDPGDVAVILLKKAPPKIVPAALPSAGLLDQMNKAGTLKNQRFVPVGYGTLRDDKTGGPYSLYDPNPLARYVADQGFLSLQPYWLLLSGNLSTGSGGTCYGDSGGPHFIAGTNVVAAITVSGDMWCRATDKDYRMDTDSARAFLGKWVTLP
jgi:hypothetical protein